MSAKLRHFHYTEESVGTSHRVHNELFIHFGFLVIPPPPLPSPSTPRILLFHYHLFHCHVKLCCLNGPFTLVVNIAFERNFFSHHPDIIHYWYICKPFKQVAAELDSFLKPGLDLS